METENTIRKWMCLALAAMLWASCEKALPVYENKDCYLKFVYENDADSIVNYSFAYGNDLVDTVWLKVRIMGYTADYDRPVQLRQVLTGKDDAPANERYVAFDDTQLVANYYKIPSGEIEAELPVVLKRAPESDTIEYVLKVAFQENDAFHIGSKENAYKKILISNQLVKPTQWDAYCSYYLGEWGKRKHEFMIEVTGEKWDNEYVDEVWTVYFQNDMNYCNYIRSLLVEALAEYEAEHGTMREEDGTPVSFDSGI